MIFSSIISFFATYSVYYTVPTVNFSFNISFFATYSVYYTVLYCRDNDATVSTFFTFRLSTFALQLLLRQKAGDFTGNLGRDFLQHRELLSSHRVSSSRTGRDRDSRHHDIIIYLRHKVHKNGQGRREWVNHHRPRATGCSPRELQIHRFFFLVRIRRVDYSET